ncbi:hypothetical protein N7510_002630 [Penicillium lagena]|uniref:uncharacterized protein n=1 Tax=Penicillium lagena TaxID=94218 RepID=UPI0025403466|nr:uncharacterized protein N7510_002630 [Penicillium lagena]KAJ5626321.1 hypothetical protein N7510_002630 [Penicillium lagena]
MEDDYRVEPQDTHRDLLPRKADAALLSRGAIRTVDQEVKIVSINWDNFPMKLALNRMRNNHQFPLVLYSHEEP